MGKQRTGAGRRKAKHESPAVGPAADEAPLTPAEESAETPPTADETAAEPTAPPAVPLDVYDLLRFCIGALNARAWVALGLLADPATGQLSKDLTQARIAIDCVDFLAKQLEGVAGESEKRDLAVMLRDLRLNYVNQSGSR